MNKRVVVGILSYIIFIYWCTTTTTNTSATNNTLFTSSATLSKDDNSPRIRVLIARAVGPSEAQNVIDDVQHNFNTHNSKSQCNRIQETNEIDPFANNTEAFPNHILCESNFVLPQVEVEYLIFARNADVAKQINNACNSSSISNVEVIDVTGDSIKVHNWISYVNEDRLIGFDYAWLVDGDILIRSLNWIAFWQQITLFKPKISQPSIIGTTKDGYSSWHPVLRHQADSRIVAAETALIELMVPLFTVDTWLGLRQIILSLPILLERIKAGGTNYIDGWWCHYAKTSLLEEHQQSPTQDPSIYKPTNHLIDPKNISSISRLMERSCVILYQTPVVHSNKKTLKKTFQFRQTTKMVEKYLVKNFNVAIFGNKAYEVFATVPRNNITRTKTNI